MCWRLLACLSFYKWIMANKHFCFGICKNDSKKKLEKVVFISFPKPTTQPEKYRRWIRWCGRPHADLNVSGNKNMYRACKCVKTRTHDLYGYFFNRWWLSLTHFDRFCHSVVIRLWVKWCIDTSWDRYNDGCFDADRYVVKT